MIHTDCTALYGKRLILAFMMPFYEVLIYLFIAVSTLAQISFYHVFFTVLTVLGVL